MVIPEKPDIKVILFDLGYTLINFEGDFFQALSDSYLALAAALVRSGISLDANEFARKFDQALSEYYRARETDLIERPVEKYLDQTLATFGYKNLPDDIIQGAMTEMYRFTQACWQIEPDAIDTLRLLMKQGYRLGMITNAANAADAHSLIDKFNLREHFEVILISAEEKIRKPDTRIYSRALRRMNATPDQAVMVGDTLSADILGAQNTGLYGIWIRRRADRPENHNLKITITPDAVIDSLKELPSAIASLK